MTKWRETDKLRYDDSVYEQAVYGTENDDW